MNEELRKELSDEQADAYLARIGLSPVRRAPDREYLDLLIRAQLRHVPFDCADVWVSGKEPSLATDDLFSKIVQRQRGGYCFELNLLFWRLLQNLGFSAHMVIVHLGRPGAVPEIGVPAHCAVIATIDGLDYFADVGYGGPVPDGSVPLNGTLVNGHISSENGIYTVVSSIEADGTKTARFTFKNLPCDPCEILPLNFYVARRENSGFASALRLNLRLDDGFAEFAGRVFRLRRGGTTLEKEVGSPQEAKEIARRYFKIPDLPVTDFKN